MKNLNPECKSFLSTLRANCVSGKNVERSTLRSNWRVLQGRNLLRGKMGSPARNLNSTIRLETCEALKGGDDL